MIYIKKKDKILCKQYNALISDDVDEAFINFEKRNRKKYAYGFIFKNDKNYQIRCSHCNHIMTVSKAKSNQKLVCEHCKSEMCLTRREQIFEEEFLAYIEKINDDLYVARYFYYKYSINRDKENLIYEDEIKREFYSLKNGLEFACYKGMRDFYSTILFRHKYDEWFPCHKYPYDRCCGGRRISSLFCQELIPEFDGNFKYCSFKEVAENGWNTSFKEHMNMYKKYKEIELAIKTKWKNGYYDIEYLADKIDFTNKKFIKKCIKYNLDHYNYFLAKYDIQEKDIEIIKNVRDYYTLEEVMEKYGYNNTLKAIYKEYSLYSWKDYLEALVMLGIPLNNELMFPRDLTEAHDRTIARLEVVKNKKFDKRIKKFARELNINVSNDKYAVVVPKSCQEIIQEGEQQHNCVGKNGYIERMAKRETIICFLRKKEDTNKSFVTIELSPDRKKVKQAYIHNNLAAPKDAMDFIKNNLLIAN